MIGHLSLTKLNNWKSWEIANFSKLTPKAQDDKDLSFVGRSRIVQDILFQAIVG